MRKGKKKWATKVEPTHRTLETVGELLARYAELARAARKHLKATNRFDPKLDFKLHTEAEFCTGALIHFFHLKEDFIVGAQEKYFKSEEFEDEVKQFCNDLIPERPILITNNLEGEIAQLMKRSKSKGKRVII